MAKPFPYFPYYVYDFDESERVIAMNLAEVGLYQLALNQAWKSGSIPDNPDQLAKLIRKKPSEVRKAWPRVRECFTENGQPGRLINPRLEEERGKAALKSSRAAASVGTRYVRNTNVAKPDTESNVEKPTNVERTCYDRSTSALARYASVSVLSTSERSTSESLSENTETGSKKTEPLYWSALLYEQHTKKSGKPLVEDWVCREYVRCKDESLDFVEYMSEIYRVHALWCATEDWQKENGRYAPKLAHWLADDGWKREPKATTAPKSKLQIMMDSL